MLEMARESFNNYIKALKRAMFNYAQGKDLERNEKLIKSIFRAFELEVEPKELTILSEGASYLFIELYVDELFFKDDGIFDKITFFDS